jgi:hypothetical protein
MESQEISKTDSSTRRQMRTIILALLLTLPSFAQNVIDTYGVQTSPNKREDIRFNAALNLVNGDWNPVQEASLVKVVTQPSKELELEVFANFSREELKMFGRSNQFDIGLFRASFHLGSTQERWAYIRGLTTAQKSQWWRTQIALALITEHLSPEQIENVLAIAKTLTANPDLKALARLEGVAIRVIGKELGTKLFGLSIPGQPCKSATTSLLANCGCAYGSYFNSCTECNMASSNECSRTEDGCGFLGFYSCDGRCKSDESN